MGYCMDQVDSEFTIKAENIDKALQAIQALAGKESITDASGRHFSWVAQDFAQCTNLVDIMSAWRWSVEFNEFEDADVAGDGDVTSIHFDGEKYGDDDILLEAIAPFVEAGSYIQMQGEDGANWRWVFDGKSCKNVQGRLVWEDEI